MSGRTVYFNGEFVLESEARVSIFGSDLMFGEMAFGALVHWVGSDSVLVDGRLPRMLRTVTLTCLFLLILGGPGAPFT